MEITIPNLGEMAYKIIRALLEIQHSTEFDLPI